MKLEKGSVQVGGETVAYEILIVDARAEEQRTADARQGKLEGNIIVVIPGHGMTVKGPKKLVTTAARLAKSKIAWCIDPVPARGGDYTEGQAIARIVRERISTLFPTAGDGDKGQGPPAQATVMGWSHGGGEVLRAAAEDPALLPQYLGLCPVGLVNRRPLELLFGFSLEALRILWARLWRLEWRYLADTVRAGMNLVYGMVRDLVRCKSFRRLVEDLQWACTKVPGQAFDYAGEVVLLLGMHDTVIRWRDVFPDCKDPEEIAQALPDYRKDNFPCVERLDVKIVEGDHVGPEGDAPAFLLPGLGFLDQLDEAVAGK
jgi:hypothetical protein